MKIHGQLEKALLENLASDPTGAGLVLGRVWYNTTSKLYKVYDGTVVQSFVDLDTAQTLSNKILASPELTGAITFNQTTTPSNPPAGKNKFYYKTDGLLYTLDSAGNEALVGSGAEGGGATNLISNGSAESTAVSIFTPYADAAGTRPVDGIGGSPTVTTAINTSNPLVKNKDFTLVKPATNCQGQGWSISNIALPLAYRGKSIKSFLEYLVNSGTFVAGSNGSSPVDGDAIVYFYDQTNSKLMEPSNIKFFSNSTTISDKYESTVQFDINCTQVRMIIHIASTSAVAWTLQVDNITLSPQNYTYGSPVTDFVLQTTSPIITGSTSGTLVIGTGGSATNKVEIARSGSEIIARYNLRIGTSGFVDVVGALVFPFPVGYSTSLSQYDVIGYGEITNNGTANPVSRLTAKVFASGFVLDSSDSGLLNSAGGLYATNTNSISITIKFKANGLSSSVQMSDGYAGRDISARYYLSSAQTIPDNNTSVIIWNAMDYDPAGRMNTSNGKFTAPSAGYYDFKGAVGTTSSINIVAGNCMSISYRINGGAFVGMVNENYQGTAFETFGYTFADRVWLNAGDYIEIYVYLDFGAASFTINSANKGTTYFTIAKEQGPQTIAASEKITAQATYGAGLALTAGTPIPYSTKIFDTHGTITTGAGAKWTAPRAGFATVRVSSGSNSTVNYQVLKNGSVYSTTPYIIATTATGGIGNGSKKIPVLAGDFLQIVPDSSSTSQVIGDFEITLD